MARRRFARSIRRIRRSFDSLTIVGNQILRLLGSPLIFILTCLAIYTSYQYKADPTKTWIAQLAAELQKSSSLKPIGDWITTRVLKLTGFVQFLPTSLTSRAYSLYYLIVSFIITVYPKNAKLLEYSFQSLYFYLLVSINRRNVRIILLAVGILSWYIGWGFSNLF